MDIINKWSSCTFFLTMAKCKNELLNLYYLEILCILSFQQSSNVQPVAADGATSCKFNLKFVAN